MGSHPWRTVTAWEPDVGAALARAQEDVFARGEFGAAYWLATLYEQMGQPPPRLPPMPVPNTIAEAREYGAEDGTGSILDVYRLADAPAVAATGPFPPELLRAALGTDRPTLAEADAGLHALYERLRRGESGYVVCHEGGAPAQLLFIGMSFD